MQKVTVLLKDTVIQRQSRSSNRYYTSLQPFMRNLPNPEEDHLEVEKHLPRLDNHGEWSLKHN